MLCAAQLSTDMGERKQPDHTYVVRPSYKQKFPVGIVKEVMKGVLKQKLSGTSYNTEVTKEIAEVIRNKLKELGLARYKYMVQVVIGEQKGEGVRYGAGFGSLLTFIA